MFYPSVKTLPVKCPSAQRQPDGLAIHAKKWLLKARFPGAPAISLIGAGGAVRNRRGYGAMSFSWAAKCVQSAGRVVSNTAGARHLVDDSAPGRREARCLCKCAASAPAELGSPEGTEGSQGRRVT